MGGNDPVALGAALVALRTRRGWSQEAAAQRIGVSRNALGSLEQGKSWPKPDTLQALATAYGLTPEQLVTGDVGERAGFDPASFEAGRQAALADMLAHLRRAGLPAEGVMNEYGVVVGGTPTPGYERRKKTGDADMSPVDEAPPSDDRKAS